VLPPGVIASTDPICPNGPNADLEPFSAPIGWDGACIAPPAIVDAAAESLTYLPPALVPCAPTTGTEPTSGSATWATLARACGQVDPLSSCDNPALTCAPASGGAAGGFRQCVFKDGEQDECPSGYSERWVFYRGIEDQLSCTACTCGPPQGTGCEAHVAVYSDPACAALLDEYSIAAAGMPDCQPSVSPGDLRGMGATWLTNDPGACEPAGGVPTGTVTPADPSTFCCVAAH
jgi:hypothetical protein